MFETPEEVTIVQKVETAPALFDVFAVFGTASQYADTNCQFPKNDSDLSGLHLLMSLMFIQSSLMPSYQCLAGKNAIHSSLELVRTLNGPHGQAVSDQVEIPKDK